MGWFLLLVVVAVAFGIAGEVAKGLVYLLAIGAVIFLLAFVLLGYQLRGRRRTR